MSPEPAPYVEWWRPALSPGRPVRNAVFSRPARAAGSSVPFWGLMAFLFIRVMAPQHLFPVLAPLRIALLAVAASIGAYVLDRFMQGPAAGRRTPAVWIAAALLGWSVLTVPNSYWPGGSLAFVMDVYVKALAAFWLLSRVVNTQQRLHRLIWGMTLMGIPLAATGVGHFLSGEFLPNVNTVTRVVGYESGVAKNPNDLALMLNLILPFSLALLGTTRRAAVRALLVATIVLYVAAVIITFSRAGFLTLVATFLYYTAKLVRRGRWGAAVAAFVLALMTIVVLPQSYLARLATIVNTEVDPTGSAQIRSKDSLIAARLVLDHPLLGVGIGMNALALNDARGPTWLRVHNVYLEYAVDLGLPGLILFLLLLGACLHDTRAVRRQIERQGRRDGLFYMAEAATASLMAFAVAAMFHPAAYDLFFYLVAGVAVAIRTVHEVEQEGTVPEGIPGGQARGMASGGAWWTIADPGGRAW